MKMMDFFEMSGGLRPGGNWRKIHSRNIPMSYAKLSPLCITRLSP